MSLPEHGQGIGSVGSLCAVGLLCYPVYAHLRQLRFLRTLPVSATRLALVMLATVLLRHCVGTVAAGRRGFVVWEPRSFLGLNSFTLVLAPTALCSPSPSGGATKRGFTLCCSSP